MKTELKNVALEYGEKGAELAIEFAFALIEDAFLPTLNSLKPHALSLAEQIYKEVEV